MTEISYITRATLAQALTMADNARTQRRLDQAIRAASREAEGFLHRKFYPSTETRTFDMPDSDSLWLYDSELSAAPTSIVSGTTTMTPADYICQPVTGPPYRWIDANDAGANYWSSGETIQRAVAVTGTFGYPVNPVTYTTTAASMDAVTSSLVTASSSVIGPGSLILVDSERMNVTGSALSATGATLNGGTDANKSTTAVVVSSGTLISTGEIITVDAERMFVEAVAGNTLTVTRGWAGTVLAAHANGATVYAPRTLTVQRGILGTTAATHTSGSSITALLAPSLVQEYVLAIAIGNVGQAAAGYSKQNEAGDSPLGGGIEGIAERCYTAYGRKTRSRAVGS